MTHIFAQIKIYDLSNWFRVFDRVESGTHSSVAQVLYTTAQHGGLAHDCGHVAGSHVVEVGSLYDLGRLHVAAAPGHGDGSGRRPGDRRVLSHRHDRWLPCNNRYLITQKSKPKYYERFTPQQLVLDRITIKNKSITNGSPCNIWLQIAQQSQLKYHEQFILQQLVLDSTIFKTKPSWTVYPQTVGFRWHNNQYWSNMNGLPSKNLY